MDIIKNLLVVGAGASYAECLELGLCEDQCLPTIKNFISKLWKTGYPINSENLILFLAANNFIKDYPELIEKKDPYEILSMLELADSTNVEKLFSFLWERDQKYPTVMANGLTMFESVLHHGIIRPLCEFILFNILDNKEIIDKHDFFEILHNIPFPKLSLASKMGNFLKANDFVMSLNYDTLFEISLDQINKKFNYVGFGACSSDKINIIKPHGSINFFINKKENKYWYSPTLFNTVLPSHNDSNYSSIMAPRLNKQFNQHHLSEIIINSIPFKYPVHLIFWGIGFTESDCDLNLLYKKWVKGSRKISFINPDAEVAYKFKRDIGGNVFQYKSVDDFLENNGEKIII